MKATRLQALVQTLHLLCYKRSSPRPRKSRRYDPVCGPSHIIKPSPPVCGHIFCRWAVR